MNKFVVGIATGFFDSNGRNIMKELQDHFLDLPEGAEVVEIPPSPGPFLSSEALLGLDAYVMLGGRLDASSLAGNDRIAGICRWGVGYDTVNLVDCGQVGIAVANAPEGVKKAMAQTAIGFVLALAHRIFDQDRGVRQGVDWSVRHEYIGPGLVGKTLGVVGLGNIGQEIVRLASVLDCEILGFDPYSSLESNLVTRVELDDLVRRSDFIIIQCALTAETRGLISRERIAMMKPTAYLVNTARGPIVDEAALIDALNSGAIAGAALDVFEQEPIGRDNPLLSMENVILTPHSAGWTDYFARRTAQSVSDSIKSIYAGEAPQNTVNRKELEASGVQPRYLRYKG